MEYYGCHLDRRSKVHVGEDTGLVADVVLVAPVALVKPERPPPLFTIWIHDNISELNLRQTGKRGIRIS